MGRGAVSARASICLTHACTRVQHTWLHLSVLMRVSAQASVSGRPLAAAQPRSEDILAIAGGS